MCEHRRRTYRYGDKTYPQWFCRDCGYENSKLPRHQAIDNMTADEIADMLYGKQR